jgi:uncharacterized damage-inducible protein DinB
MIKGARKVLLDYCGTLSLEHFTAAHPQFGKGGSIRNLLVHICNTYQGWLGKYGIEPDIEFTPFGRIENVDDARQLFATIDLLVADYLERYTDLSEEVRRDEMRVTALQFFTHVITHEFHHKGQILSLSRHWGYTPADTDIMR